MHHEVDSAALRIQDCDQLQESRAKMRGNRLDRMLRPVTTTALSGYYITCWFPDDLDLVLT